jgi:ATP adenylyltransferase
MARRPASASRPPEQIRAGYRRLWAPWRSAYLSSVASGHQRCIFCLGRLGAAARSRRLVLHADRLALVMLNRYPYNNGHLLIAPRRHVASLELLNREERALLSELTALAIERLRALLHPAAFNIGANLGRAAGAGFADHMHWHVVPRWEGDTNFMPVVGSTRVLSQHLEESYALLAPHFKAIETALS